MHHGFSKNADSCNPQILFKKLTKIKEFIILPTPILIKHLQNAMHTAFDLHKQIHVSLSPFLFSLLHVTEMHVLSFINHLIVTTCRQQRNRIHVHVIRTSYTYSHSVHKKRNSSLYFH